MRSSVALFILAGLTMPGPLSAAETASPTKPERPQVEAAGPRGPVGPDVPLTDAEARQLAKRVAVEGRTAVAVQNACDRAAKEGVPTVFLPAGTYVLETTVRVGGGLVLLGAGSASVVEAGKRDTHLFLVDGDRVRLTRLKLQGADTTPSEANDTFGVVVEGKKNVRVDHCELLGFSYATDFTAEAAAQVDHCSIHDNPRDGLGYGVALYSGACVLVADNDFSQCRHALASNGDLDWSSPKRVGKYVHKAGVRKTHWEFIHNRVHGDDRTKYQLCAVDTHPGMDGTFVVEGNLFENLTIAVGIRDGSGLIRRNLFRSLASGKDYRPAVAISITYDTHNGVPVENAMPHDIEVEENAFQGADEKPYEKYRIGKAERITLDGKLVPETRTQSPGSPPAMPRLQEMGEEGILIVREPAPAK